MIVPTNNDVDWRNPDCDDVVIREQPATACYWNANGAIVIRQERAWDEDSDTLVLIQPENVAAFAGKLLALLAERQGQCATREEYRAGDDINTVYEAISGSECGPEASHVVTGESPTLHLVEKEMDL